MEGPGLVESIAPRGRAQWVVAVVAVLFLAAAAGYAVRAFAEPNPNVLSSTDEGFLLDMVDHHDQAVEMSIIGQERAAAEIVRDFSSEVILQQRWEVGVMETVLGRAGAVRGTDPDRPAMGWMGMAPVPVSEMAGMATAEELRELRTASPERVDVLWLELMIDHHVAGADMADYAAENGSNSYVRRFATDIARNQRAEIREYQVVLADLTGAVAP